MPKEKDEEVKLAKLLAERIAALPKPVQAFYLNHVEQTLRAIAPSR